MIDFDAVDFSLSVILKKWEISFDAQCLHMHIHQQN